MIKRRKRLSLRTETIRSLTLRDVVGAGLTGPIDTFQHGCTTTCPSIRACTPACASNDLQPGSCWGCD